MQNKNKIGDTADPPKALRPAIVFDDIDEEFGDYITSKDEGPKLPQKVPIVDECVVKMRIVLALSIRVRAKMTKGEFRNDLEGVLNTESNSHKYVILTCMDHNELTADKFYTIYLIRSTRRPSNMHFSDMFLVNEEKK